MEVEAKFSIPNERTFQRLLETTSLAGFGLVDATVVELYDRYLDTADGALRAGGYACRLRRQNGQYMATLKGLGTVSGAVHRRAEHEVELGGPLPPQSWPASKARDLALQLAHDAPLLPLFEIKQSRHSRHLMDGSRTVAELNLDRVRLPGCEEVDTTILVLEAELLPDGEEEDLERLALELEQQWGLVPDSQSKFERGLASSGLKPAPPQED